MWFDLGGVRVAIEAALNFSQTYEPIGGTALLRMMGGGAVQQVWWRRLRTTLSADGWWPPGLDGLDYDSPLTLLCAVPRQIQSASPVIVLPPNRRTDAGYTPLGYALVRGQSTQVGGGDLVPTPLALAGDTATLTAVAGAAAYVAAWWPSLTVYATPPTSEGDPTAGAHRWSLTAEEV